MNIPEINKLIDKAYRQPPYMPNRESLLELIKQHDYKFDKDEVLEIYNRAFGRWSGEFFTPNKVSELIAVICQIYNQKTVIDICCGYGNLLSYFKNMQTVKGIDINTDSIQLAQYINPNADFSVGNSLEYNFDNTKYDLVVGQPPFNARISDRRLLDIELIKKGLELLNHNGVAVFVVSENLLVSSNRELSEFRQQLLSNFSLDMIISLPAVIFHPYTGIKTSIIVVRNGKKNKDIFMPNFEGNSVEIVDNFKQHKGNFYLPISKITDRLDRKYYVLQEVIEEILNGHEVIKLGDIAEIINGRVLNRDAFKADGSYLVFNRQDSKGNNFVDDIPNDDFILKSDDIVVCLNGQNNKVYFYKYDGIKTVINQGYVIIRPRDNDRYITTYLQTEHGIELFKKQINQNLVGSAMLHFSCSSLRNFDIPIVTFSKPEKLFSELVSKSFLLNEKRERFLIKNSIYLFLSSESLGKKEYGLARKYIDLAFELADDDEENKHKVVYFQNIDKAQELEEKNQQLQSKEKELEDMMSMFAHKFRSPLDAIIYNTSHGKDTKLYTESANTMRGLLDIFSIISADDKILTDKIKNDSKGNATLMSVLNKNLNMTLLHLLSVSGMSKIHQHYMNYAKAQGKITDAVSYKEWCEDYFEIEIALQKQWEQEFSALLNQSASLAERLQWLEHYFFKLDIIGFEIESIQFKEYETTESFLFILMNEILVNAFKYYASKNKQPVILEWTATENIQILSCRNPSIRRERDQHKGSGKGHTFLSALARKTGCKFTKPKPQDDFLLEFAIPNQLLLSNSGTKK